MSKFNFTTRTSAADAQLRSRDLVDVIKSPSLVSGVENQVDLDSIMPAEIEDPYPVIILINGSGGCGKGTLIKQIRQYCTKPVYELSTVDPLRPVAKKLMEYQQDLFKDLFTEDPMTAQEEEDEKGGPYRQFLSDLKYAWSNHVEGPNTYVVGTTLKLIEDRSWTVDENTGLPIRPKDDLVEITNLKFTEPDSYDMPAMIFINAREPKNLEELQHEFWELGLLCITMKMEGIEHEVKNLADSDILVDEFEYDITVKNKGTVDDLSVLAFTLNTFVNRANRMYGISVSQSKIDPRIAIGKEALRIIHEEIDGKELNGTYSSLDSITSFDAMSLDAQLTELETRLNNVAYINAANRLEIERVSIVETNADDPNKPSVNTLGRIDSVDPFHTITVLTVEEFAELARKIVRDIRYGATDCLDHIIHTVTGNRPEQTASNRTPNKEESAFSPTSFHPNAADRDGLWPEGPELENDRNS